MHPKTIKEQYQDAQEVVELRRRELRAAQSYLDQAQAEAERLFNLIPLE